MLHAIHFNVATNIISGNSGDGISITGVYAAGNRIIGNFIGTNVTGTNALGNGNSGVFINSFGNIKWLYIHGIHCQAIC